MCVHNHNHATSFLYTCIGNDLHNVVVIPSEIPLISQFQLPTNATFLVSTTDSMGSLVSMTLNIVLSKFSIFCAMISL